MEQEYNRSTDKHHKDNPKLKRYFDTNKVVHKSLLKQTKLNKKIKLIERKMFKVSHVPMTIKEIQGGHLSRNTGRKIFTT